jgi:GR25 family glycosyltransferase involved in LPS biosynthesis
LEDDIILHDDFLKKINYLFKIIPKDWEHIYLSGIPRLSKIDQTYMLFNQVVPVIHQNIQRVDGTCAFFINSNSYDKVIKKLMTLQTTPDDLITHMINVDNNLKSYIYFPFICYVNDEYSYIGDGVKNNRVHPSKQFYKE